MAWVSGSIPRHVRLGWDCFLHFTVCCVRSALPFCGSSPHPPLVPMPAAHAAGLPPSKGPQLCASCGQDAQSTEVTRNLFQSPASPVTFL